MDPKRACFGDLSGLLRAKAWCLRTASPRGTDLPWACCPPCLCALSGSLVASCPLAAKPMVCLQYISWVWREGEERKHIRGGRRESGGPETQLLLQPGDPHGVQGLKTNPLPRKGQATQVSPLTQGAPIFTMS